MLGIKRNAELVRNLPLDIKGQEDERELVSKFNNAINDYFALIKSPKVPPIDDLCHAISAFVLCRENHSVSAAPSPQTHQRVSNILRQLEDVKLRRRGLLPQACTANSEQVITTGSLETQSVTTLTNSMANPTNRTRRKKKRRHGGRKQKKKWSKAAKRRRNHRRSKFKSRNNDKHDRYSPKLVKDITKASPVDESDLRNMTPDPPRPRRPATSVVTNSATRSQQKKALTEKERPEPAENMKTHKNSFQAAFKTVTLTLGSLSGCLRRATNLSGSEISDIVARINEAVHILSITRQVVFKALEFFLYKSLNEDQHVVQGQMDPLDLILHKQHGETLVRNLLALVLYGSISGCGPRSTGIALQARKLAKDIYDDLKEIIPDLNPTNPNNLPLGIVKADLAVNIRMAIREHFGRLPVLITKKLVKIGSTDVPQLEYTDKDGDGEDNEDTDDILIEESKLRFKTGHVKQWWKYYISLPAELRPVFCPTANLKDTFNLFQETAF
ncbi:hypothetical protein BGX31_003999, partial [Mortierella sp. GBA43]